MIYWCKCCLGGRTWNAGNTWFNKRYGHYCYDCGKWNLTFWGHLEKILGILEILFMPWSQSGRQCWKYLLAPRTKDQAFFRTIWCRWRGHRCGMIWYNPGGTEPDYTCKNCGDDIG